MLQSRIQRHWHSLSAGISRIDFVTVPLPGVHATLQSLGAQFSMLAPAGARLRAARRQNPYSARTGGAAAPEGSREWLATL
jgi:hypothetical protein